MINLITYREYDFDFDNQFTRCEKYDSKKGYKMEKGYFPSVVYVGNYTLYFENKNGNSNVKFHQYETLIKVFELSKTNSVKVDRVPMD